LSLMAVKSLSKQPSKRYVIWSRIDQKSCLKAISAAGLEVVPIQLLRDAKYPDDHSLRTDTKAIEAKILELGAENVVCVLSTTSTFAPRVPDDVQGIAAICKNLGVGHVINNAYGLQCGKIMHAIEQASRKGRVDAIIQSMDKNFMVPVGGAIICGENKTIEQIAKSYPGRASGAPTLDLLITFLSMGNDGLKGLWKGRKDLFKKFQTDLAAKCGQLGLRVLNTPDNSISLCIDLSGMVDSKPDAAERQKLLTSLGGKLFNNRVSGPRVVACPNCPAKEIDGNEFSNYGAHHDDFEFPYLATAAAMGATDSELQIFLKRFDDEVSKIKASSSS